MLCTYTALQVHYNVNCIPDLTVDEGSRGGSRISGKGVHINKGVGVGFADFILFFLNIP